MGGKVRAGAGLVPAGTGLVAWPWVDGAAAKIAAKATTTSCNSCS